MISFLAPAALAFAALGTLVLTALHFLSVRRPPVLLLPTARFVVARDVRAVSRSTRPTDLTLLFIRLAYVSYVPWKKPDATQAGQG